MKDLAKRVVECVAATNATMNDWDQRSAIGMVDRWVATGQLMVWNANQQLAEGHAQIQVPNRDALAQSLVEVLVGASKGDCKEALAAARAKVNEPFIDPAMLGWQARRVKDGAVGSDKKNEKMGLD